MDFSLDHLIKFQKEFPDKVVIVECKNNKDYFIRYNNTEYKMSLMLFIEYLKLPKSIRRPNNI